MEQGRLKGHTIKKCYKKRGVNLAFCRLPSRLSRGVFPKSDIESSTSQGEVSSNNERDVCVHDYYEHLTQQTSHKH